MKSALSCLIIDSVWIKAAKDCGITVGRTNEAFANYDGKGMLWIGSNETLDENDSLAQLVFHELCHSLAQGPDSFQKVDWGLDFEGEADLSPEYQALKLQALLSYEVTLWDEFQPTTEHRVYYQNLQGTYLEQLKNDSNMKILLQRSLRFPWNGALQKALIETRDFLKFNQNL